MDKIIITQAKYMCYVGTQPDELINKQELFIDIQINFDIRKSAISDDIKDTIDYRDINKRIEYILEKRHNLIETVAEKISRDLLNFFEIDKIWVKVNKPASLKNASHCSIEITRFKETTISEKTYSKAELEQIKI